jgi:hypothetical protein
MSNEGCGFLVAVRGQCSVGICSESTAKACVRVPAKLQQCYSLRVAIRENFVNRASLFLKIEPAAADARGSWIDGGRVCCRMQ